MLTVACVLKTGGDFNAEHVKRLKRNVADFLPVCHDFVCLSDIRIPGVDVIPLACGWPGWWSKWELYKLHGPVIFFDLDTMILGDLTPLLRHALNEPFSMLSDFYFPARLASGVMCWKEDVSFLYEHFRDRLCQNTNIFNVRTPLEQKMVSEYYLQEKGTAPLMLQEYMEGIHSYKVHGVRKDCMVLCFHGKPRPWACEEVSALWKAYIIE